MRDVILPCVKQHLTVSPGGTHPTQNMLAHVLEPVITVLVNLIGAITVLR
jgi:hypothetical protein